MNEDLAPLLVLARELSTSVQLLGRQLVSLETRMDELNGQLESLERTCCVDMTDRLVQIDAACPGTP